MSHYRPIFIINKNCRLQTCNSSINESAAIMGKLICCYKVIESGISFIFHNLYYITADKLFMLRVETSR